jgi:transcription initiation factor TFIID subunit 6
VGLNHREVQCIDDHELQLDQVITAPMPKIPLDICIRSKRHFFWIETKTYLTFFFLAHWLAIEGKQPTINENPEIISKADLTTDSLDPVRFWKN